MKKTIFLLMLSVAVSAGAQGWVYSTELGTDVWSNQRSSDVEFVDCNTGTRSIQATATCMRRDVQYGLSNPTFITSKMTNTNGLYGKVARGVAAAQPRRSGYTKPTSAKQARRMGKNYTHQTSDAHRQWLEEKRERQIQAQQEAAERKRQEELERRIADDNRAAAVTAQTNAMLQQQTDRRIARDHYHANEGAKLAQQRARQAHRRVGPQFNQANPKSTGKEKARMLRGENKPRRIMYPQTQRRNTARKQLAQVRRQTLTPERAAMLQKALMVRAELRRRKKAAQTYADYKGIKLDDNAVSTLGKDWHSDDFKTQPLAPPPVTRVEISKDNLHELMMEEFFGIKPVKTDVYRQLIDEEIISTL
mgnify:CR=1 FL=1